MSKCQRYILLIFVVLLILAFSFIPCTKIEQGRRKEGLVFSPVYVLNKVKLKRLSQEYSLKITEKKDTSQVFTRIASLKKYRLKRELFLTECVVVFLICDFVYILFCLGLSKSRKGFLTKSQELTMFIWLFMASLILIVVGINRANVIVFIKAQAVFFTLFIVFAGGTRIIQHLKRND